MNKIIIINLKTKKIMKKTINKLLLMLFIFLSSAIVSFAQPPNPPDPLGGSGSPDGLTCGTAPISDGIYLFIIFAITYGIYKFYQYKRQHKTV